jgi:predicted RNase H-like HicB family nuclease
MPLKSIVALPEIVKEKSFRGKFHVIWHTKELCYHAAAFNEHGIGQGGKGLTPEEAIGNLEEALFLEQREETDEGQKEIIKRDF